MLPCDWSLSREEEGTTVDAASCSQFLKPGLFPTMTTDKLNAFEATNCTQISQAQRALKQAYRLAWHPHRHSSSMLTTLTCQQVHPLGLKFNGTTFFMMRPGTVSVKNHGAQTTHPLINPIICGTLLVLIYHFVS